MHSSRFTPGHNTTDTKKGLTMNTTNTISNSPNTSGTNSSAVGAGNANTSPAGADTASNSTTGATNSSAADTRNTDETTSVVANSSAAPASRAESAFDLTGRTAIVTGGSTGIGRGIVESLLAQGANVTIAALQDDNLTDTQESFKDQNVLVIPCDVTSSEDCGTVVAKTVSSFGGVDIVAANAGAYPQAPIDEIDGATMGKLLDLNVGGTVNIITAALPELRRRAGQTHAGRIIVTSSITGNYTGYPKWSHYGASKAAQMGYVRSAAIELAKDHITVNAVLPGNILTGSLGDVSESYVADMSAAVPGGQLGDPQDIGNAVAFLASDAARFINGHGIVVDGGQILPESAAALDEA